MSSIGFDSDDRRMTGLEYRIIELCREIILSNPGSLDVTAISLWDSKADAEAYKINTYPEVLRTFERMIDGTPKVQTSEAVTSTFHNVHVAA